MKIQLIHSIAEISPAAWNGLRSPQNFPFTRFEFLHALEKQDCVGPRTGWSPRYVTAWGDEEAQQDLLAAALWYVKTNSYGEYIFDFAWAQAFESVGLAYYPKWVSAIPFTPATGTKILTKPNLTAEEKLRVSETLQRAADAFVSQSGGSSAHALFIPKSMLSLYEEAGYFIRHSYQFHWCNEAYADFEDFLTKLRSKRRREILRERQQVRDGGVTVRRLTGDALTPQVSRQMFQFYLNTLQKMGGYDYLTEGFFLEVFRTMKDQLLVVMAYDRHGQAVAGALNYFGADTLFGRHWGCNEDYKALHFEVCYYQGIEFAIEKGLSLFEAGAQGEHKFQRGFLPSLTYSAHKIHEPRLNTAIRDFTEREKEQIRWLFADYESHNPFQRSP
jgi:hypothetical protein